MDRSQLEKICQQIYRRFPELKNKQPKVTTQGNERYLLVFSSSGKTPDGKTVQQNVRVVADENGHILKTSTSR